jgi:hypothetical protein
MQYLAAWAKNKVLPGFDTIEILGFFTNSGNRGKTSGKLRFAGHVVVASN